VSDAIKFGIVVVVLCEILPMGLSKRCAHVSLGSLEFSFGATGALCFGVCEAVLSRRRVPWHLNIVLGTTNLVPSSKKVKSLGDGQDRNVLPVHRGDGEMRTIHPYLVYDRVNSRLGTQSTTPMVL
jgi:hypothetical protein